MIENSWLTHISEFHSLATIFHKEVHTFYVSVYDVMSVQVKNSQA